MQLVLFKARAHCWLMFNLMSTRTPGPFLELLPIWSAPRIYWMVHGAVPPQGQDFVLAHVGPPGVQVFQEVRKSCLFGLRCTLLSLIPLFLTSSHRLDFMKEVLLPSPPSQGIPQPHYSPPLSQIPVIPGVEKVRF